jgi:hypothetical protein
MQVDRGCAEIGVAELPLDYVQRHPFTGRPRRVGVAQLMRREAAPDTRSGGEPANLPALCGCSSVSGLRLIGTAR